MEFLKNAALKKETLEEMTARLCAQCVKSGDDLVKARREVWDMMEAARNDYLDIVKGFSLSLKEELSKRATRWGEISAQKDELLEKEAAAETRLGAALLDGNEDAAGAAEKDLDGIHKNIERVEARLRIFERATFKKSGEEALAKAEDALRAYQLVTTDCSRIMNAIQDAYWSHIHDFEEKSGRLSPGVFPCNMGSLPELKIPEKYSLDKLRHMANDPLTIEEIQNI